MFNILFSHSINLCHISGMTVVTIFPMLSVIEEEIFNCKFSSKFYIFLSSLPASVLVSYIFKNDVCLLSEVEHYLNPSYFESYTVSTETKIILKMSTLFTFLPAFIKNKKKRLIIFGSYYAFILGSLGYMFIKR